MFNIACCESCIGVAEGEEGVHLESSCLVRMHEKQSACINGHPKRSCTELRIV